jgi:hypothetical protein
MEMWTSTISHTKTLTLSEKSIFAIATRRIFVATSVTLQPHSISRPNIAEQGGKEVRQCVFYYYIYQVIKKPLPLLLSAIGVTNNDASKDDVNNDNAPNEEDADEPEDDHEDAHKEKMASKAKLSAVPKAAPATKPPAKVAPPAAKNPPSRSTPLTCATRPSLSTTMTRGLTTPKLRSTSTA